jgi:ribosome-binding factor A|tara:strand:- start:3682 stop:4020 length:339 start_codon:yes stop_codon:yes gene_type:complete
MYQRIDKINALLRQEISSIISQEISDPRVSFTVSVVNVETSRDLGLAKVYVTDIGDLEHKRKALEGLNSASNFIRRLLRKKINLKKVPALEFLDDNSIEEGAIISKKLDGLF